MKKILITGGAGYVGSVITNLLLEKGYSVKVLDTLLFKKDVPLINRLHPNYTFVKANICNDSILKKEIEGVDFIIHAAAIVGEPASRKFPELTYNTNCKASVNLIKYAAKIGSKGLIFFSTCSNYGITDGIATEDTKVKPLSLYAETKIEVERYLMDNVKKLNWAICRLSTVYGVSPRMRFDLTVNDFTLNAYINKQIDLFLPYTYRPYIHVFDVATAVLGIIEQFDKVKNNVFNVGYNEGNYQKSQIANFIKNFIPETRIEIVKKGATDTRDYQVDFSKIRKFLNFKNKYTVNDGIADIISLLKTGVISNPKDRIYYNTYLYPGDL